MIYIKKHPTDNGEMVAMCDEELLGKIFTEGKIELDLEKYSEFYRGELMDEEKAKKYVGYSLYTANIVGKRSVAIVIEKGLVSEDSVRRIAGVEVVQIFMIK